MPLNAFKIVYIVSECQRKMKSWSPQTRLWFYVRVGKTTFHLREVRNLSFPLQFQQFFVCFLAMYTIHLRRFDLGFSVHFLSILVVSNKLFKLPSSLLLCMLCVHYPPKDIWFKVGTHFLFVLIVTYELFQHVYYCVCCVCIVHFIRRFDLGFGTHFLCPNSYRPWLFTCLLLCMLCVHYVHALDKPQRVHS